MIARLLVLMMRNKEKSIGIRKIWKGRSKAEVIEERERSFEANHRVHVSVRE